MTIGQKIVNKVRKIYRPKINTRAVNLSPFIPDEWEYVEVRLNIKTDSYIVITLIYIGVDKLDVNLSRDTLEDVE